MSQMALLTATVAFAKFVCRNELVGECHGLVPWIVTFVAKRAEAGNFRSSVAASVTIHGASPWHLPRNKPVPARKFVVRSINH